MRATLQKVFTEVWSEQNQSTAPVLLDETVLLDTGLDSLGFAIMITRLEETLGFDPFSISEDPFYPQTFREFYTFYETNQPVQ